MSVIPYAFHHSSAPLSSSTLQRSNTIFHLPSVSQVLADPNFVTSLKTYDKDNVKPAIIDRIRKEFTSNPEFTPANAAKASSAAEVGFIT